MVVQKAAAKASRSSSTRPLDLFLQLEMNQGALGTLSASKPLIAHSTNLFAGLRGGSPFYKHYPEHA